MIGLMVCLLKPRQSVHISTLGRSVVCDVTYHRMTQHANVDTLSRLPIPYQEVVAMDETTTDRRMDELRAIFACHKWSSGTLHSNIKTSTAAQPGQLFIELPKRKTFYHRSHNGNIDDREGSTMQTQSPDDRLEGISIIKCQIGAVKATGLVILGGKQPQLGSKSCKVEIDGGGVWKRHADQMTTTGVGNGIEDEPVSMAVEPEWRLDRQVPEVLPDSSDTEPGDMPGKLTSVNSTSPLAPHQRRNHLDNGQLSLVESIHAVKIEVEWSCLDVQLLNAFVMLETELWLGITGLVILGGKQPQLGSKSCKVEIDGGGVWKRHADQMTTTGVGNGIEDEPVSMAVEPEWRLDRQVPEVLPDSSDTEPGDMPGKLTSVNSTSPLDPHQRRNHLDIGQLSPGWPKTVEDILLVCFDKCHERTTEQDSSLLKPDLRNQCSKMSDRSCRGLQLLNAFLMLETELWLEITGLVILGGNQPQLGSKSCKVEIDGGGVWKRHADQMTTTGVGNGIEDEPVSMAVEPEWRLDRQDDSADQSYP
eukprot:Em0027g2a